MHTITQKHFKQKWEIGNIISDGTTLLMIVRDGFEGKYRLLDIASGYLQGECEYTSIEALSNEWGDFNPISHAEILYAD